MQEFEKWFNNNYDSVSKNGKCRVSGSVSTYHDVPVVLSKYIIQNDYKEQPPTKEEVREFIMNKMQNDQSTDKNKCIDYRKFVESWVANQDKYVFDSTWSYIMHGSFTVDILDVADEIMLDTCKIGAPLRKEMVVAALERISADKKVSSLSTCQESIQYSESYVDKCDQLLRALYDFFQVKNPYEVFQTIMKHWAWLVKRRMWNNPDKWQIWPHFYGPQGLGKTTTLEKLCAPIRGFYDTIPLSKMLDTTREIKQLANNFVLICDELAINDNSHDLTSGSHTLSKDAMATIKSLITRKEGKVRVMGGQNQMGVKFNFSTISSANEHIYDVIFDITGMRRWFEFDCSDAVKKPFEEINEYLSHPEYFWKGVDETIADGYLLPDSEVGLHIAEEQKKYYPTTTTTGMWIKSCHVKAGKIGTSNSWSAYKEWCRESNHQPRSQENWRRDLEHLIPECIRDDDTIGLEWSEFIDGKLSGSVSENAPREISMFGVNNNAYVEGMK